MYDNYRKLIQKDVIVRSAALGCLLKRGISQSIAEQYHITTLEMDSSVLVFPFYDENGEMVTVEYCNVDCVQDVDETKEWFETDTKPILFGMHQCSDSEKLIITDSKFNCLTLAECDIANAVSIPGKKRGMEWVKHCYEWVDTFKQIIIFGEYTDGYMPLAEEIAKCFPEKVIRVVKHPDYLGEKDANAILLKYGKDADDREDYDYSER